MTDISALAREWLEAFNTHDLPRILSYYHDEVVLTSPSYLRFTEGKSSTLRGKAELERYFGWGLAAYPDLKFTLQEVFPGADSVCLMYHTTARDRMACECMQFDNNGHITLVLAHYNYK